MLVPGLAGSISLRSGSVCCNLESPMDVSLLAFKAKCLGCSSLRCRPEELGCSKGFKPFLPKEKWSFEFFLILSCCAGGGFYDEIVFSLYLLPCAFSFAQCRGVGLLLLLFGLSSEAVVSPVAVNAVCLGGV